MKVLKFPDAKIHLLLKYPCNDKEELEMKEAEYIKKYDCVNKLIPGRKFKDYYRDNRAMRIQMSKDYYSKNIDKIKKNQSTVIECECGKKYTKSNKSRHVKTKKHLQYVKE
jgi:hypothetical protein